MFFLLFFSFCLTFPYVLSTCFNMYIITGSHHSVFAAVLDLTDMQRCKPYIKVFLCKLSAVLLCLHNWIPLPICIEQGNKRFENAGAYLISQMPSKCNERSLFLWYCQLSDCFVEQTSEVREGGGERTASTLPTVACLLSFDLLPQVSWRMDEQKGQCRGSAQHALPPPSSCLVFTFFPSCV